MKHLSEQLYLPCLARFSKSMSTSSLIMVQLASILFTLLLNCWNCVQCLNQCPSCWEVKGNSSLAGHYYHQPSEQEAFTLRVSDSKVVYLRILNCSVRRTRMGSLAALLFCLSLSTWLSVYLPVCLSV